MNNSTKLSFSFILRIQQQETKHGYAHTTSSWLCPDDERWGKGKWDLSVNM